MIDIRLLRDDPDGVKAALARRGVAASEIDEIIAADVAHRARLSRSESLRAEVKSLSREVGEAKKAGDEARATELSEQSRRLGEDERSAAAEADVEWEKVRLGTALPAQHPDGRGSRRGERRRQRRDPPLVARQGVGCARTGAS